MGAYIDDNGKLNYRFGEEAKGKPYVSPEILKGAGDMAKDVGGTVAKTAAVGTVAAGAGSAITASGATAIMAGAAGAAIGVIALEAMKSDQEEAVETTPLETAHGGKDYQKVMQQYANSTNESAQIAQDSLNPFEAFQQCMEKAGMQGVNSTEEINTNTACLPQKASRGQARGFSLN